MLYGYEGADNSDIIKNYSTNKGKIIINYLDGSTYEVPLTEENEKAILDVMLQEAKDRDESDALQNAKDKKMRSLLMLLPSITCAVVGGGLLVNGCLDYNVGKSEVEALYAKVFLGSVLASLGSVTLFGTGISLTYSKKEIEELRKYHLYLKIKDEYENSNDENKRCGINPSRPELNINTLDEYRLKEIKKIESNLKHGKKLQRVINKHKN